MPNPWHGAVYFISKNIILWDVQMNMCEDHVYDMFCEVNVSYSIQKNAHKDILIF